MSLNLARMLIYALNNRRGSEMGEFTQVNQAVVDTANAEIERLRSIIFKLTNNAHLNLGDLVYQVRDREGLGWDGPSVKSWSDAVTAAENEFKTTKGETV